jgi:hypothetical protein
MTKIEPKLQTTSVWVFRFEFSQFEIYLPEFVSDFAIRISDFDRLRLGMMKEDSRLGSD